MTKYGPNYTKSRIVGIMRDNTDPRAQACRGDSGGPLLTRQGASGGLTSTWSLIGLVSFGSRHCGGEAPSVLTRVTSYLDWIAEHTRDAEIQ